MAVRPLDLQHQADVLEREARSAIEPRERAILLAFVKRLRERAAELEGRRVHG